MPPAAPRYPRKLLRAVRRLDDESTSLAETCRRVGAFAEQQGVPRPSIVHLRLYVAAERRRKREVRRIRDDAVARFAAGLVPEVGRVALEVREANLRARNLVADSHKGRLRPPAPTRAARPRSRAP